MSPTPPHQRRRSHPGRATLRLGTAVLTVGLSTMAVTLLRVPEAGAATDLVSSCSGDPTVTGSLPYVVAQASAGDTITFSVTCGSGSPIVLTQTLAIGLDLTIDGPGAAALDVSGGNRVTVMSVASGVTVAISGVTIENGRAATAAAGSNGLDDNGGLGGGGGTGQTGGHGGTGRNGGGIDNSGILSLTDVVVTDNAAGSGGTGGVGGTANGGNGAQSGTAGGTGGSGGNGGTGGDGGLGGVGGNGGGIYNSGTLSLIASTVSANAAGAGGAGGAGGDALGASGGAGGNNPSGTAGGTGGIGGNGGISGAGGAGGTGGSGGGIYSSGTVSLVDSTVSANAAGAGGGGGHGGSAGSGSAGPGGEGGSQSGGDGGTAGAAGIGGIGGAGGTGGTGGGIDDTDSATLTNSTVALNAAGTGGHGGAGGDADGANGGGGFGDISPNATGGNGGNGGNGGVGGNGGAGGAGAGGGGLTNSGSLILTSTTIASNAAGSGAAGGSGGGAFGGIGGQAGIGGPDSGQQGNQGTHGSSGATGGAGAGGGVGGVVSTNTSTFTATIVASNAPENCDLGGFVSEYGPNLDSGDSCGFVLLDDLINTDPLLGAPAENGGPTETMAPSLSPPSPVIDVVAADRCPATDQRGAPRTAPCDIGAYDTDQAPFTTAIDVALSGSQTVNSDTPTFTQTNDAPNGVTVGGTPTCTTVDGGTPINSGLAGGSYTIDPSSCSGLTSSNAQYPIFPSTTTGVPNGFVVSKDTTSVELSAVPASEPAGSEASTSFTVTVLTGQGEELPGTENVTVDVGTTNCVAPVAPAALGGSGSCSIGNSDLPAGAYTASASYQGDADLQGSGPSDASFNVSLGLTPPPLPNPVFDLPYTTTITAAGATAPTTFTKTGGSLPAGITLQTSGVLSGTPTNAAQIGMPFTFTVQAKDSASPANVATQAYTMTEASPCAAGLTIYILSATTGTGNFTGVFCLNTFGTGTYIQGAVHGTGTVTSSFGVTHITAFGTNLALIGQKTTTKSTITETAPGPVKGGTFTLSSGP